MTKEGMIMSTTYREVNRQDWVETGRYLLLWLLAIGAGGFILLPTYWFIWVVIVGSTLWGLVDWHARQFAYRCAQCAHEFTIPTWVDFISPQGITRQGGGWKSLQCPHCHTRTRARVLRIRR